MCKRFLGIFLIVAAFWGSTILAEESSTCFHHHHKRHSQTTNFLGPLLQLTITPCPIADCAAISFLGEAGPRLFRYGGTLGMLNGNNRLKISAEQLGQRLEYRFSHDKVRRWVRQYAVGGAYQYTLCNCWIESIDLEVSYSKAFDRSLCPIPCHDNDPTTCTTLHRRIVGGRNAHASAGLTLTPWKCATLSISADYDNTRFVRRFRHDQTHSGFGGSARLNQLLPCNFYLNVAGQFRQPFNYYEASLGWGKSIDNTFMNVRLFGSYTQGFDRQPNVSTVGLAFDLAFGGAPMFAQNDKLYVNANTCNNTCNAPCYVIDPCLLAWVSNPAVYMPVVLAHASEHVVRKEICQLPVLVQSLPAQVFFPDVGNTFNAAPFFSSTTPLTFSLSPQTSNFSISPTTGIVTYLGGEPNPNPLTVSITASNSCGSVTGQTSFNTCTIGNQTCQNDLQCGPNERCFCGKCACSPGFSNCNCICVDKRNDPNNCGSCGHVCPGPNPSCTNGKCCFLGKNCSSTEGCGPNQVCNGGTCTCTQRFSACGCACKDLQNDSDNCGSCGHICTYPTPDCVLGGCRGGDE